VAEPVVDGLEGSVCGVVVTAIAELDWELVRGVLRREECQ